jgi:signal peptidase I
METTSEPSRAEDKNISPSEPRMQDDLSDASQAQAQSTEDLFRPQPAPPLTKPARPARSAFEPLFVILIILIVVFLRLYVYESDIVQGISMMPSLKSGDYLLVNKLAFQRRQPSRFDIITFPSPEDTREILIKRVIGLPGEWVHVWGTTVYINGQPLSEPYARWRIPSFKQPVWAPPDYVYVMGDNRDNSEDSRDLGPINIDTVRGRAIAAYFPVDRAKVLRSY